MHKTREGCENYATEVSTMASEVKRRRFNSDKVNAAKEVCDVILMQCEKRFSFTNHLEASQLLAVNNFSIYNENFPDDELEHSIAAYPMLEKYKLKSELAVLYSRDDFCKS